MVETLLHTGSEHPELTWIVVASALSFVAGLGLGAYRDRIRALVARSSPAAE